MTDWWPVEQEIAAWPRLGGALPLWLRDDDVAQANTALEVFLGIIDEYYIPVVMAAIPAGLTDIAAKRLIAEQRVSIAQHGYAHRNYAPFWSKKMELGDHRRLQTVMDELLLGRARLRFLFGERAIPLLVPPWNRISDAVARASIGPVAMALSSHREALSTTGLPILNTQVDIIDWKGSRGCRDHRTLIGELANGLRKARISGGTPVGILTHHLVHDESANAFLRALFDRTAGLWADGASLMSYSVNSRSS